MRDPSADPKSVPATLYWAHERLGLTYAQIGVILGTSERTVRRWQGGVGGPGPRRTARFDELRTLRDVLHAVFPDEESGDEWLQAPSPMLHGRTPISELRRGRVSRIVGVLATLESGAFL